MIKDNSETNSQTITVADLKKLNIKNGGHFFDTRNLKARREKMSDYRITHRAPHYVLLERKDGATWPFSIKTGRVMFPFKEPNEMQAITRSVGTTGKDLHPKATTPKLPKGTTCPRCGYVHDFSKPCRW